MGKRKKGKHWAERVFPRTNWEQIFECLWSLNGVSNKEKELYYKFLMNGLPVKGRFLGLPSVIKKCSLCEQVDETVEHLFRLCEKVRECYRDFKREGKHIVGYTPNLDGIRGTTFGQGVDMEKAMKLNIKYLSSVWYARGCTYWGKTVDPRTLFLRR